MRSDSVEIGFKTIKLGSKSVKMGRGSGLFSQESAFGETGYTNLHEKKISR